MSEKISVTRALTEIKHLKDRIKRATLTPVFVGVKSGSNAFEKMQSSTKSVAEFVAQSKADYQSVTDMISRYDMLKRNVIKSNALTTVVINNVTMTVAEAIEKKSSITFESDLLIKLRNDLGRARQTVEIANAKLNAEIEAAVTAAYSNEKGKVDAEQYNAVANPRLARNELHVVDAIDVEEKIRKMEHDIEIFAQEIDFVLSESNSSTFIEV